MTASLIHGDCLHALPMLPAGSVDLVLADLPYGTTQSPWDAVIPFAPLWAELERLCPDGPIVLFAAQPFTSALVMSNINRFRHEWVWRKNKTTGHLNASRRPMRQHEDVLVFGPSNLAYQPQVSEGHEPGHAAKLYSSGAARKSTPCYGKHRDTPYGGQTTRYPTTILDYSIVNNADPFRGHPNQKPIDLLFYLIETYSIAGAAVLDPTMGSGSTGEACRLTGRAFVGIERDPESFAFAERRLKGAMRSRRDARRDKAAGKPADHGPLFAEPAPGAPA